MLNERGALYTYITKINTIYQRYLIFHVGDVFFCSICTTKARGCFSSYDYFKPMIIDDLLQRQCLWAETNEMLNVSECVKCGSSYDYPLFHTDVTSSRLTTFETLIRCDSFRRTRAGGK